MHHRKPPAVVPLPIAAGLLACQAAAMGFVRASNLRVLAHAQAIAAAGFVPLPAGQAARPLATWTEAACGALFFTLTVGAVLSLAGFALYWLWDRKTRRHPAIAGTELALLAGTIAWLNSTGWNPAATGMAVATVAAVGATAWVQGRSRAAASTAAPTLWLAPLVVLTVLWSTQAGPDLFLNIRDHLLLGNRTGKAVNDFYYRHTLAPAMVIKPLAGQSVRTVFIEPGPLSEQVPVHQLLAHDLIPVAGRATAQVRMRPLGRQWLLETDRARLQVAPDALASRTAEVIARLSAADDIHGPFRRLILAGLLVGFPVLLYTVVFGTLAAIGWLVAGSRLARPVAAASCLAIGLLLLWPVFSAGRTADRLPAGAALEATATPAARIAVLRRMARGQVPAAALASRPQVLDDPHPAVRYWAAQALGRDNSPATAPLLWKAMDDPHPNVVCQALASWARRSDTIDTQRIVGKLKTSDHWYVQWYAYRALKKKGWRQGR